MQNVINKFSEDHVPSRRNKERPFSMDQYKLRNIFLKISYLGWNYHGLQRQEVTKNTVVEKLVECLLRTRLITDKDICIHLCGRTDKGVSAYGQAISLKVRSNLFQGLGICEDTGPHAKEPTVEKEEIDYPLILNKVLPDDIRVLGWAEVPVDKHARYNCKRRSYYYYIPYADLDLGKMMEAGQKLIGTHDYRNFCTYQIQNGVTHHVRQITRVELHNSKNENLDISEGARDPDDFFMLFIEARSFLYHQIRSIVTYLLLMGKGLEEPSLIDDLLDIEKVPSKPQFTMSADFPLLFYDCQFDDVNWKISEQASVELLKHMQNIYNEQEIKSQICRTIFNRIKMNHFDKFNKSVQEKLIANKLNKICNELLPTIKHKKIIERPRGPTVEELVLKHGIKDRKRDSSDEESSPKCKTIRTE